VQQVKAPNDYGEYTKAKVFLAGSIEMGTARDWQRDVAESLSDLDVVLLNPRRDDFDPDAKQSIHDDYFRGQVEWELGALEAADAILLYFAPGTKSPISLLELGLFGRTGKLVVCCPEGFWRKGNVDIVCAAYGIEQAETVDEATAKLRERLHHA
jgi:hypothetical protein